MPRIHCLTTPDGRPDWPWIVLLISCTAAVILIYTRIYFFFLKSYLAEEPGFRNTKFFAMANVFLGCATASYIMSGVMFVWPAYRLLAIILVIQAGLALSYIWDLSPMASTFAARRFLQEISTSESLLKKTNENIGIVLANVRQGFLLLDQQARIGAERSAVVETWFGTIPAETTFGELLGQHDPDFEQCFNNGWKMVVEDMMPAELTVEQLPKQLVLEDRNIHIAYRPTVENGKLKEVTVVMSDVTAQLRRDRKEQLQRDFLEVVRRYHKQPVQVREFIKESDQLVASLVDSTLPNREEELRAIHTLKGNTALFGISSVSDFAHVLEGRLAASGDRPSNEDREALAHLWHAFMDQLSIILDLNHQGVEVSFTDIHRFQRAVSDRVEHDGLRRLMRSWQLEPAHTRFQRFAEQAQALCIRLGKGDLQVDIQGEVRLGSDRWANFWAAFSHVIRNHVSHGVWDMDNRPSGYIPKLSLFAGIRDGILLIKGEDNGPGVDWDAVKSKAQAMGLAHTSRDDLVAALFEDGFSTKEHVDETSGRGIGMGAIAEATKALGGTIHIDSTTGSGTSIRFHFPPDNLGTQDLGVLLATSDLTAYKPQEQSPC